MVFSSSTFLFFFLPITLFFYFVAFRKNRLLQNIWLFIVSLVFYAWGEPVFVFLMIACILLNWFCALMVDKYKSRKKISIFWLVFGITCDIIILFIFKYLSFVAKNIGLLFSNDAIVLNITLPIGISFFTFQAMSYIIDTYRGKGEVQKNPLYVGLYISFFPQLIAGPIVRYETVCEQISYRRESVALFSSGIERFIIGISKKVIIANTMAIIADSAFGMSNPSVCMSWFGAIAYTLQIFFDFSGYSDMAIGLGKMFGFEFDENFNYPYISNSISEFWRRWHISMGTWFRDYVYFPLGGSRRKKSRVIFNLFVVWLLTGIWHGANWTFIVWGLLYFCLIALEKMTNFEKRKIPKSLKWIYTMFFVVIGWVVFRSESLSSTLAYLKSMFGQGVFIDKIFTVYLKENIVIFILAIIFCFPVLKLLNKLSVKYQRMSYIIKGVILLILFLISITYTIKGSYNPFIYFNF